jgi:V-type H+-transporting ATPase subunit D
VLISAQIKIKTRKDNVAGVNLPVFESYQVGVSKFLSFLFFEGTYRLARLDQPKCDTIV